MKRISALITFLLVCLQPSCVVVGGYSSESGWYIWPGSLISLLVVAVVFLLLRRRGRG